MRNATLFLGLVIVSEALFSLPINPILTKGDAEFIAAQTELKVFGKNDAVIDWEEFSIQDCEKVSFHLPSEDSLVLNRVTGSHRSEIFGQLSSNGRIVLINPQGILFGSKSVIDVGSLLASTFDLQRDLYLQNKEIAWISTKNSGMIQHAGKIFANRIELNANEIYLFENSVCDVSNKTFGGEIHIGDRERNSFVWASKDAMLLADALEKGAGGKVYVLSSGIADFQGKIFARGGTLGGDGGFVEVSGGYLNYTGLSDLRSEFGKNGTILLDPTDITIGPANSNLDISGPFTFTFPLSCGGTSNLSRQIMTLGGFSSSSISIATLGAQLVMGNIIIDSTTGAGGSGNITWNAGANFDGTSVPMYSSANDLILRAPITGTVTILSNVQNDLTGNLIIDSLGPLVQINTAANGQAVSFGTKDGLTRICAPNATVTLQAGNTSTSDQAQVGYFAGDMVTATGPIEVTCNALNLFGSSPINCYAQIGHGQMGAAASQFMVTTSTATIDVEVAGNIDMRCSFFAPGASSRCGAMIGHGQRSFSPISTLDGDITVVSGGNITITANPVGGSQGCVGRIGHGTSGALPGSNFTSNANISVEAAGDITLQYTTAGGSGHICSIGHTTTTATITGDITVVSGRNITLLGHATAATFSRVTIGHFSASSGLPITSNVRVFACGDINMTTNNSDVFGIGAVVTSAANPVIGDVEVVAGGRITLVSNGTSNGGRIGNSLSGAGTVTRTFVASGNDISISGLRNCGIGGFGDIFVSCGRDLFLTQTSTNTSFIGTDAKNVAGGSLTQVFARGNVIASNPVAGGRAVIGRGPTPTATYTCSLDVRAGGNIQLSSPFTTNAGGVLIPTSGSIFIEADTDLPTGAFWTVAGGQVTTIGGQTPNLPVPISIANTSCTPTAYSSSSTVLPADAIGAVSFNTGGNGGSFGLQTTVGNITLHSAPSNGVSNQSLTIGTGLNNANILTTSGNIEIWGSQTSSSCVRGDSFYDVTLNQAITTTGSVFISANNDLTMTAASSITTTGAPVILIVDNQMPFSPLIGTGSFIMDSGSSIATGGGLLQIYTALQSANAVNGTLNGVFPFMPGTLYQDTNQEIWCTYFCGPLPGSPFTISYKDCLQLVLEQAMVILAEMPVDLHPYNEFPGWKVEFFFKYRDIPEMANVPYYLRRRHLNLFNHPKTYTVYQ